MSQSLEWIYYPVLGLLPESSWLVLIILIAFGVCILMALLLMKLLSYLQRW